MDQERIRQSLEGLSGIYVAIGGDVAPTRGRLFTEHYPTRGGDNDQVFLGCLTKLFEWGQQAGVDVRSLVGKIPAATT